MMADVIWWLLTAVYAPDYEKWMSWCPKIISHPLTYYAKTDVHYPPLGSLLPALVWYLGHGLLGLNPLDWRFRLLWKLPVWIGTLACVYCARRVGMGRTGQLVVALSTAYPCAFWQLDPIPVSMALAAIIMRERWLGGTLAALAFWTKPTAGLLALPHLRRESLIAFVLVTAVVLVPYLLGNGWAFLQDVVLFQMGRPPQNCSIWTLVTPPTELPVALLAAAMLLPLVAPGEPERRSCAVGAALLAFSKVVNPNYWAVSCPAACLASERLGLLLLSTGALFTVAAGLHVSASHGYFNAEDGRFYRLEDLFLPPPPTPAVHVPPALARALLDGAVVYNFLVAAWVYVRCVARGSMI